MIRTLAIAVAVGSTATSSIIRHPDGGEVIAGECRHAIYRSAEACAAYAIM